MEPEIKTLFKMQSAISQKLSEIQNLKVIFDNELEIFTQNFDDLKNLYQVINQNNPLTMLHDMNKKISTIIAEISKFKNDMIQVFLLSEKNHTKNKAMDKQMIEKLTIDLTKQLNINKVMKDEVFELNELINEHVLINKKKIEEKDRTIQILKSKFEEFKQKTYHQETLSKNLQLQIENFMKNIGTAQIMATYASTQSVIIPPPQNILNNNLPIIKQEEQSILSVKNPSEKRSLISQYDSTQTQELNSMQIHKKQNVIRSTSSSRKIETKDKTKFFIQDFRKSISNNNIGALEFQNFNQIQKSQIQDISRSSSQSELSIGRNDYTNLVIPYKNISPKKHIFTKKRLNNQNECINGIGTALGKREQNSRPKIIQIKNIFNERILREKGNSKQKLYLTQKLNLKDSVVKQSSKQRNSDSFYIKSPLMRPSSKQKITLTTKSNCENIPQSSKIKFNPMYKLSLTKKNLSLATQKFVKNYLDNIKISVGQQKYELKYEGKKTNGLRQGHGRLEYCNGLVYEGEFKQNARQGFGKISLNNLTIYQGKWQRNKLCGYGTLKNIDLINKNRLPEQINIKNLYYVGEFEENKFHGNGTLYFSTTQKLIARFHDGFPEGQYTFYNKFGEIQFAVWESKQS